MLAAQLPTYCCFGVHPSLSIQSQRSIPSFIFNTRLTVQSKHLPAINHRTFTSNSFEFSELPYFIKKMERVSDCEIEDLEEKDETVPVRKQKRQWKSDSLSDTSPPPKKSHQSGNSALQQSEEPESYSVSLTVGNLQKARIGVAGDDYKLRRSSLAEHNEGEWDSSELSCRLEEGNTAGPTQHISEPELSNEKKSDCCSLDGQTEVIDPKEDASDCQGKVHENLLKGSYSILSHSKHLSGDNLEEVSLTESLGQDISVTESLDQADSLIESGIFPYGISETECESLSSSQILFDDNFSKLEENVSHVDSDEIIDKAEKVVPTLGKDKKKHSKKQSKKRSKHDKKHMKNTDDGEVENKNLRPNYFVGIQISNPDIHKSIVKIQEDLVSLDEFLAKSFVDVATSHITLLVAHIDTEDSLTVACAALDECSNRMTDDFSTNPLLLTFSGVSHFSHQVVYACLVEDEHYLRLMNLAETVRQVFLEKGVCMPDTKVLHPHLTIAKISKAPRIKGKRTPRKIDPSCYKKHLQIHFGCQTVCGLQLLAMNKPKDEKRYYYSSKEFLFDVKCKENTDHSECCFPRRPMLFTQISKKHQRSLSTSSALPESPQGWLLPTVGVMTALAAAVVLGFIVVKYRSKF
ncbi:uncharacterized protein [Panulirus ornatus]|uniref:uncharacterized protein isoform X2 n=1 Tax=Panulirus ornatus TaxID=150431 RepID=UPI003A838847